MMKLIFALLLISIHFVYRAQGATCKSVRLDGPDGPFSHLPHYDQRQIAKDDSDICYAITAAQLLDADRFFRGDSLAQVASPISVAANYKKSQAKPSAEDHRDHELGNGGVTNALKAVRNQDVCDQRWFERLVSLEAREHFRAKPPKMNSTDRLTKNVRLETETHAGDFSAAQICSPDFLALGKLGLVDLDSLSRSLTEASKQNSSIDRILEFSESVCAGHKFTAKINDVQSLSIVQAPDSSPSEISSLTRLLREGKISRQEYQSRMILVHNRTPLTEAVLKSRDDAINKMNELLEGEKPVPIGITVDSRVLHAGVRGINHAMVVMGQRDEGNGCEFLIRNSYGYDCESKSGSPRYNVSCENGDLWISADGLKQYSNSLSWIPR